MASRTKQKEEARARRLAEEQARHERARRQRRLQMIAGVVLAAVAVIAVAIVISSNAGGGASTGLQKGPTASKTVSAVQQLLAGVPQSGGILGNPKAPVTMVYYGDLECPVCKDFTLSGGFPQLVANDIRAGKVKVQYRAFQTATRDPTTFLTQQAAALAAGKQNQFWNFVELFYHEQGSETSSYVNESYLDGLAHQLPGLNFNSWRSARSDPALATQVQTEIQSGTSAGVSGTPTLIFQGPHGKATAQTGVPSYSQLEQSIKSVS